MQEIERSSGTTCKERLRTVVLGLGKSELVDVVLDQLSELVQEIAALASIELGPWTLLEGSTGSSDGKI